MFQKYVNASQMMFILFYLYFNQIKQSGNLKKVKRAKVKGSNFADNVIKIDHKFYTKQKNTKVQIGVNKTDLHKCAFDKV